MIPSNKWFPASLTDRAVWFNNFSNQFAIVATSLGFVVGDVTKVGNDNAVMQFVSTVATTLDAYKDAARQFRMIVTEGNIGDPTPAFPANMAFTAPDDTLTGIFERLDDLVKRIRVAPAYTDETGALLGIVPNGSNGPTPLDAPPVLVGSVDPGNIVEVKFTKGSSDGLYIETNVDGGGWGFAEKAVKSPAVFAVPASLGGTPRGVQIRARFLVGNNPVGDWSDIVTVQTVP